MLWDSVETLPPPLVLSPWQRLTAVGQLEAPPPELHNLESAGIHLVERLLIMMIYDTGNESGP